MACTCVHSPVRLPSNTVSMITRSSLQSPTLRARCQSKLDVRTVGSQQLRRDSGRDDSTLLKLGDRSDSVARLSVSRRVNLTKCAALRGEGETKTAVDESALPLMDVVTKRVQPYLRLARFRWTLAGPWNLTLAPFCWGAALAAENGTLPDWKIYTVFAAAAFILHCSLCTVNDLWDKDLDGKVERSKNRPLVTGEVTPFQGWAFFGAQNILYIAIMSQLEAFSLSSQFPVLIAIQFILNTIYPLAKRWTYWTPAVLGLGMNWSVFLGWAAVRGSVALDNSSALAPALLYFGAWWWTILLDAIYAHQDIKYDRDAGIKSLPQLLTIGGKSKLWFTSFGTAFVATLGMVGQLAALGWPYYVGVAATAIHVGWQVGTVDIENPTDCWNKFRSNIWVGAFVFGGIASAKFLA